MHLPPTISEAAAAIRAGKLTSVALVERCLERIDRYDEKIHAWVLVDREGALKAADAADRELAGGYDRGPLHGIPIGIKDIIDVEGMPTRCGSPITGPDPVEKDAAVVALLREAGAIILGKTVTCEWACFDPSPTRNPWNLESSPGGSSSGSAAAVAAGMCLGAIGTQTGGSIIRPAAFCGACGLKPAYEALKSHGVSPCSVTLDHVGAFAASAIDLIALYCAAAGARTLFEHEDGDDPLTELLPFDAADLGHPPKIAIFEDPLRTRIDSEVTAVISVCIRTLNEAGAEFIEVWLPTGFDSCRQDHRTIMAFEAAEFHIRSSGRQLKQFGPRIQELLVEGAAISRADYDAAIRRRQEFQMAFANWHRDFDVVLTPATSQVAPGLESTGDSSMQSPWSFAGVPSVTIPAGLSREGLPVGLQLVGRASLDMDLCRTAAWCERAIGFKGRPPLDLL